MQNTTATTAILPVHVENFKFECGADRPIITSEQDRYAIQQAVVQLSRGEPVGIPTETVYGLAANALSASAVSKIFAAKHRPQDNPLIVHVSSLAMLRSILPNSTIPPVYEPVIRQYWPGPLTLILPTNPELIPASVTCGQPTVAVRFPSHPVARALIDACGFPLAAPSANSSGKPSPTLASHVYDDLKGRIPLILDGGPCDVGLESTVLDGLRQPPAILRPGGVTYEALRQLPGFEGVQVYRKHFVDKALEMAPTTPGMKYRHYSPEATVVLFAKGGEEFDSQWRRVLKDMQKTQSITRIGIMRTTEPATKEGQELSLSVKEVVMGQEPEQVARNMFRGLRELDAHQVQVIFVQGVPETEEGMAVMNRLRKAATTVIES